MAEMGASTRLQINSGDFDGAKNSLSLHLFANALGCEFFGGAIAHGNFAIRENDGVGGASSAFQDQFGRLRSTQVDRADRFTEMKRNGDQTEALLKNSREQMLAGVLLHVIETTRPIDATLGASRGNRTIHYVQDAVIGIVHVDDVGITKFAEIMGLAAGGRI
jgi:hypothetical protein